MEEYVDSYGNRRTRVVAPVGRLTLWSDCIVENDGAPDPYDWNARQHGIAGLPFEALKTPDADLLREMIGFAAIG